MSKKIVISFPGGRGAEVPLLYFAAKHYEDLGYEKVFISHPISKEYSFEALLDNADKIVKEINFCEYEDIVNSVDFDLNIDIYDGFYLYNFSEYIKIIKEK